MPALYSKRIEMSQMKWNEMKLNRLWYGIVCVSVSEWVYSVAIIGSTIEEQCEKASKYFTKGEVVRRKCQDRKTKWKIAHIWTLEPAGNIFFDDWKKKARSLTGGTQTERRSGWVERVVGVHPCENTTGRTKNYDKNGAHKIKSNRMNGRQMCFSPIDA